MISMNKDIQDIKSNYRSSWKPRGTRISGTRTSRIQRGTRSSRIS